MIKTFSHRVVRYRRQRTEIYHLVLATLWIFAWLVQPLAIESAEPKSPSTGSVEIWYRGKRADSTGSSTRLATPTRTSLSRAENRPVWDRVGLNSLQQRKTTPERFQRTPTPIVLPVGQTKGSWLDQIRGNIQREIYGPRKGMTWSPLRGSGMSLGEYHRATLRSPVPLPAKPDETGPKSTESDENPPKSQTPILPGKPQSIFAPKDDVQRSGWQPVWEKGTSSSDPRAQSWR